MSKKTELAAAAYQEKRNCAQSVIAAFYEDMGLTEEAAMRLMEGFGGGIGGMQDVCGALSGAVAAISYGLSSGRLNDPENKQKVYAAVRQVAEQFEKEYGSINCRDILYGASPKAHNCLSKVTDAVTIAEKLLAEK